MKVQFDKTGEVLDIPDSAAGEFAAQGGYSFPEDAAIPVKHDDGSVSAVPVQQYLQQSALYRPATQTDVQAHLEQQQKQEAAVRDAALQQQYGEGIANTVRAGAEGVARGATFGASDWVQTQLGVDATGLREREQRNPVAAMTGELIGTIAPLVLTGGESAIVSGAARLTPVAVADAIGIAVGKKVTERLGEGFAARLAAGSANMAVQGALAGVGGEISDRAVNGKALLDEGTMSEYLMSAGTGGLVGGVLGGAGHLVLEGAGAGLRLGGKAIETSKSLGRQAIDVLNAPGAEADAAVRAAEQRLQEVKPEDLAPAEGAAKEAKARAEAAAPKSRSLSGAAGMRADASLEAIGRKVKEEAVALGVPQDAADHAWQRIQDGREAYTTIGQERDGSIRRIAAAGDELQQLNEKILDRMDMQRRNTTLREALATDRTAAPPEQFVGAMREQFARIRDTVREFENDPESQVKSWAQKLGKHLDKSGTEMADLGTEAVHRSDAFEILDQANRLLGRVRDKIGDRTNLGIATFPEALSGLYEDTRQLLKNPNVVGEKVSAVSGQAKTRWSDFFDVSGGYRRNLLAQDAGGARTVAGFDTVDRWDPAKVGGLLDKANSAEGQLQLELVGRGLDTKSKLFEHFASDLGAEGETASMIKRHQILSQQIADDIVSYRSKAALAEEFVRNTAPALKEMDASEAKLAGLRERAQAKFEKEQGRAQLALEKAQANATEVKRGGSVQSAILDTVLSAGGYALGGVGGAIGAHGVAKLLGSLAAPVLKQMATVGLQSSIRTGQVMQQLEHVATIGRRLNAATAAIGDVLRTGKPLEAIEKEVASRSRRNVQEEYNKTTENVKRLAATDARAAYLMTVMPVQRERPQLRPDLDKTPTVAPLEQRKFLRQVKAATDPVSVIEDFSKGRGTHEGAHAVQTLYPTLFSRSMRGMMQHASELTKAPSMSAQRHLSILAGQPLHFTSAPEYVQFAQTAYQGQGQQAQSAPLAGKSRARNVQMKSLVGVATPGQRLEGGVGAR